MSDSEASNASTVMPASDDLFASERSPVSERTVVVDALNYLRMFVPFDEAEFKNASAPILFAETKNRVRDVADAARVASLNLIWVFDNGQATKEAKEKWLKRRFLEITQARRSMPCSADTVLYALLQEAGFTVLFPPGIDGDDAVALISWKLNGDALSGDRDMLRYAPELPRSRVYRSFAIDRGSGRLVLEAQCAPLPKGTAPRSLYEICNELKWPGPTHLCAKWGMHEPTMCAKAREGKDKRGNADSFTASHGNLHVHALKLQEAVYAELGIDDAVTTKLPEAVSNDASAEDNTIRAALVWREVFPDHCTAKRIVASSAKLARQWLYEETLLPDTPEGRRERAHAVCMIAAEIVDAMWFAQGSDRCVSKGACYSPAVRTLALYNKLVCTDPHLRQDAADAENLRVARGGKDHWCALMPCQGILDRRRQTHEGCVWSGHSFPDQNRFYELARGKDPLCSKCLAKLKAFIRAAELKKADSS
jgi:hypothetical protein